MKQTMAVMKRTVWVAVLVFGLTPSSSAGMIKESWYMSRGKANMNIKNYNAAIEAFEKLIEIDPNNREAMKLLGQAYESQGLTTKAVEHYDRYLKKYPDDAEIAFKQANILEWSRFSYRGNDAVAYYRIGLAIKDDPVQRHRLAKLLSKNKETLSDALKEYRILIKGDPKNKALGDEYRKLLVWDEQYVSEAVKEYERAVKLYPGDRGIRLQLARLYAKDDDHTDEAIREYKALAAQKPDDLSLREEYAKALAKSRSHFDEAKVEFEYILSKRNTYGTRLAYADLISQDKDMRGEALAQYRQLLDQKPDQTEVRYKYASLLSAEKKDLDKAIAQYNIILKKNPKHAGAHQQLAQAYAWKGDNDRSIYHANLALKYQPKNANASRLRTNMMKGREPRLTTTLSMFNQDGDDDNYDMDGVNLTTGYRTDLNPFITAQADIGYERYWNGDQKLDGPLGRIGLEYRLDSRQTLSGFFTHHAFRDGEKGTEYGLEYVLEKPSFTVAPGFKRSLKYDSLLSLGSTDAFNPPGAPMGTARSNLAYCRVQTTRSNTVITGTPYIGTIDTLSAGDNVLVGIDADANYEFLNKTSWTMAVVYRIQLAHYQKDYSGFVDQDSSPYPGGYFSPDLYAGNTLSLAYRYVFPKNAELFVQAGPSFQYAKASSDEASLGADVTLSYLKQLKDALYIKVEGDYKQVSDAYRKMIFTAVVTYRF